MITADMSYETLPLNVEMGNMEMLVSWHNSYIQPLHPHYGWLNAWFSDGKKLSPTSIVTQNVANIEE